jgi:hypothetical protein
VANFVWHGVLVFRHLVCKPPLLLHEPRFLGLPSGGSQIATLAKARQMSNGFMLTRRDKGQAFLTDRPGSRWGLLHTFRRSPQTCHIPE